MPQDYRTIPITGNMRMYEIGAFPSRGGNITLDTYLDNDEIFKIIYATVGGVVNVEGIDGRTYLVNVQDNGAVPALGRRVMTASTTATGLKWGGGC